MAQDIDGRELHVGDLVERVDPGGGFLPFRIGAKKRIVRINEHDGLIDFGGGDPLIFGRRVRFVNENVDDIVWVQATAYNVVVGSRVRRKDNPANPARNMTAHLDIFPNGSIATVTNLPKGQFRGGPDFKQYVFVDRHRAHNGGDLSIWLNNLDVEVNKPMLKFEPGAKVRRIKHQHNTGVYGSWPVGAVGTIDRFAHPNPNTWYVRHYSKELNREYTDYVFYENEMELIGDTVVVDDIIRTGDYVHRTDNRSQYFDKGNQYLVKYVGPDGRLQIRDQWGELRLISPFGFKKVIPDTKKPAPPKFVLNTDKLVEVIKGIADAHCNGAASYGYVNEKYVFDMDINHACHAGLRKDVVHHKYDTKSVVSMVNFLYCADDAFTKDDMRILFDFITDPVRSPYRDMLDGAIAVEGKKQFVLAITDLSWSGLHVASLFKTFRLFTERACHNNARMFLHLVKDGVDPAVAFYIAQQWKLPFVRALGGHGLMFDVATDKCLTAFVGGKLPDKGNPWKEDPSYYGCDTLWGRAGKDYQGFLLETYKDIVSPPKQVTGAFVKNVPVGGLSLESLTKIAHLECDRLGLSDQ